MSGHLTFRTGAVRYQVTDVERAVAFYTENLGFDIAIRGGPAFASVVNGNLTVFLSGPGSSGARQLPDGTAQKPGGYNRVVLEVDDLDAAITELRRAGVTFRNTVEEGPGGRQIQITDPDGNPVEIFEAAAVRPPTK
ncbi:glyoxalase [Mycolicibacterium conceptionense]|jgi:glyoxylase I family protein|uniref:Glyoxalase n=2 Tax=Mycolicibacterium TaxID=1866885 RepID=A0ABR5FRI6_9MYCO|nr:MULTISPECIES: VOC family protein [Mycolicibacterium]KLI08052.1 glyoxalase [Mycolicibacterium senegalense]KLO50554.1 glyoxalase [Mycolicibacterium senegalense]KMV18722.1 glyoxalase [Mycolicibacterium conceptionense]OBJ94098.1 glyoxalase [Mycolicibacterium conceptionense]OMB77335.1 glyoxalase [Mycolicibacterium conceptionense]